MVRVVDTSEVLRAIAGLQAASNVYTEYKNVANDCFYFICIPVQPI